MPDEQTLQRPWPCRNQRNSPFCMRNLSRWLEDQQPSNVAAFVSPGLVSMKGGAALLAVREDLKRDYSRSAKRRGMSSNAQ